MPYRALCGPTAALGSSMAPDSASRPSPATAPPTAHNGERSGQGSYIWLLPSPPPSTFSPQPATCLSSQPAFPLDGQKTRFKPSLSPHPLDTAPNARHIPGYLGGPWTPEEHAAFRSNTQPKAR